MRETIKKFLLRGKASIILGLIFLSLCSFLLIVGKEQIAEKSAIWAYIFLAVGIVQMFIECTKKEKRDARGQE